MLLIFKALCVPCLVICIDIYPCLSYGLVTLKGVLKIENSRVIKIQNSSPWVLLGTKRYWTPSQMKIIHPGQAQFSSSTALNKCPMHSKYSEYFYLFLLIFKLLDQREDMFNKKHEIQASQSCQTFPRGIKIGTFFYVLRREMAEKRSSLHFHCWFFMAVTMVMTCMRLKAK